MANTLKTPNKILALQFKYLGDAVFMTPALKAIKTQFPNAQLHVLVADDKAPLLDGLDFVDKLWAMPRKRGKGNIKASIRAMWPVIKQLRSEQYDRVVDFGGNDRGALLSWLSGAPVRLSYRETKHNLMRSLAYTTAIDIASLDPAYARMHLDLLGEWGIAMPPTLKLSIAKPQAALKQWLASSAVLCHIGTSQAKKEWPVSAWHAFHQLATKAGLQLVFSAGPNAREQALLADLNRLDPSIKTLPRTNNLDEFLAAIQQAMFFISGDTGPLHFAAALDIPVIGLYGVINSMKQASPNYAADEKVTVNTCSCTSAEKQDMKVCPSQPHCMQTLAPEAVLSLLQTRLAAA